MSAQQMRSACAAAPVFLTFSEPARSTRSSLPRRAAAPSAPARSTVSVSRRWLRLDSAFSCVKPTARFFTPSASQYSTSVSDTTRTCRPARERVSASGNHPENARKRREPEGAMVEQCVSMPAPLGARLGCVADEGAARALVHLQVVARRAQQVAARAPRRQTRRRKSQRVNNRCTAGMGHSSRPAASRRTGCAPCTPPPA